jgi:hypothetical protein
MNNLEITKATIQNVDELQKISRQTFYESFSSQNTEDNMNKYLSEVLFAAKLSTELNNHNTDFYFAYLDNKLIRYLIINLGEAQIGTQN